MTEDRLHLLATVADLYYREKRSQSEIARLTGYSRSAVSRLLTEARERGVVEIRINHPIRRSADLEEALLRRFNLIAALVAHRGQADYPRMLRKLGRLGAAYLIDHLTPTSSLGISAGTGVYEVAQALSQRRWSDFRVVQMIGSIGSIDPIIDGHELTRLIASTFGGTYNTLNTPLIVDDNETQQALLRQQHVQEIFEMASQVSYALVGIGSTVPERSSLLRAGHLSSEEIAALQAAGAVGDICAHHFDKNGNLFDSGIQRRTIAVDIRLLTATGKCTIVAVSGGRAKAPAILGALRGGLVHVLITDSSAAEAILALERKAPVLIG